MLLTSPPGPTGRTQAEAGSALAVVVALLAVTGIIAATLLTVAVYGTGFTSASRAGVQAAAAAEGGIDYAFANLSLCNPTTSTIVSPAGSAPSFRVSVSYRTKRTGPWTPGCPPLDATGLRLVSAGTAAHAGVAGHARGNTRTMEAVYAYEFPFLALGDRSISLTGALTVHDTDVRPADMSTNRDFTCGGGFIIRGVLYVAGTTNCAGKTVVSTFDATTAPHVMPKLAQGDARWPRTPATLPGGTCTVTGTTVTFTTRGAVNCAGLLKLQNAEFVLKGDVVLFAPQISVDDLRVRSEGGRFSLYLVKPWPASQSACPAADGTPDVAGKKIVTDDATSVMLYSSAEVQLDSPEGLPVRAQLYGCQVETKGSPKLAYAPTGPMVLVSKRDVTG